MKYRLSLLLIWFAFIWTILIARGLQIQLFPSNNLEIAGLKQYQRMVRLYSKRGDIFDRNGEQLAISVPAASLFADPMMIKQPRQTANKLAKILPLSYKTIYKKLTKKNSRFVWISRLMEEPVRKKIAEMNIKGLGFKEEFKRVYPNKNLLAHTIGFVGADGRGLEGLESRYDSYLHAEDEALNLPKDGRSRYLVEDGWLFMQNRDGDDVYLTVDADLQYFVEQELKKTIAHHEADGAWAVVLDPKTSEVLALASAPDFDLNRVTSASEASRRNRFATDVYEPGSTMKTMFLAGALNRHVVEPNTVFDTSKGEIEIDKHTIRESDNNHRYPQLTTSEILAVSSNVGVAKISLKMKGAEIYEDLKKFGFGEKTGLDIAGESKGLFSPPPWRDHLKANISFGHGIAVTAIQVANAYAAIANGGMLNKPYIVSKKRGISGLISVGRPDPIRRVMTTKEAERMKMLLIEATGEKGTGKAARVKGFPVAGKTGTAQKVDPKGLGYLKGQYISSFVGFLPANDPEFLIYVVVDNPKKNGYYGSETAAPAFSRIAQYAINKKGVVPVTITADDLIKSESDAKEILEGVEDNDVIPNMAGWTMRETIRYMKANDISMKVIGQKGRVVRTTPSAGQEWPEDKALRVYIE